ncbi:exosortase/archaeosortase family protein [Sphingomonas natans]|nr:exosortase/archaeosortase family protein [Sphingomonas sp. BIUV-7]
MSLYVPVFIDFGARFWLNEEDSHSGLLLVGIIWAYYSDRAAFNATAEDRDFFFGALIITVGLIAYFIGRVTEFFQLQGLSLPVVVFGLTLSNGGWQNVRRFLLINGLLIFTVPLLGPLGDAVLVPLRLALTAAAADLVRHFGYFVGTNGVIVTIGYVNLNIAGACIGLRSMVSLFAIGMLFIYYFPLERKSLTFAFIVLLPFIGLLANYLRIVALILIAGTFGATVESGMHDIAAYLEVGVAVGLFFVLVNTLQRYAQVS